MTEYIETSFSIRPYDRDIADLLPVFLAEYGYETFTDTEGGLKGYVKEALYSDSDVDAAIASLPIQTSTITYTNKSVPCEDWNRKWIEESFTPVEVGENCIIHSPNHLVDTDTKYDIVVAPVMAFGSGHHQTTYMMAEHLIRDFEAGKTFLDMGCGTGVLAILASKLGAKSVTAIDIDEMAYENCIENIRLNSAGNINVLLGDSTAIGSSRFDAIAANINRNILLADMPAYAKALNRGGALYLSGFYVSDIEAVKNSAIKNGLEFVKSEAREEWASLKFQKP